MKRWNMLIAFLLMLAFLSGCGQAPAMPATAASTTDVRMEATMVTPAAVHTDVETDVPTTAAAEAETEAAMTTEPILESQSTEPAEQAQSETDAPQETKSPDAIPSPTSPSKPPEQPKPTEPPAPPATQAPEEPTQPAPEPSSEPPAPAPTEAPTEPPAEPPTEPPTEAPTEPATEPPTEAPTPTIDIAALEAYGNQYAAQLGFQVDYSMTTGNASFFPPNSAILNSTEDGYRLVTEQVSVTREFLMAYIGSIEGARARVLVSKDSNGWFTCTVLYG